MMVMARTMARQRYARGENDMNRSVKSRDAGRRLVRAAFPALRSTLLTLVVGIAPAAAFAAADDSADRTASQQLTKIVGGTEAQAETWPFQVALGRPRANGRIRQFCGGSVIAPKWVLTAAHCVINRAESDFRVLVGTNDLDTGGRRLQVRSVRVHPGYSGGLYPINDIALVELVRPSGVAPVALATAMDTAFLASPGSMATVIGWGALREIACRSEPKPDTFPCRTADGERGYYVDALTGGPVEPDDVLTSRLMEVNVPIVGEAICRAAYPGAVIDHRTVCAGLQLGGKDSCQGDSGGPMVVRGSHGWVQIGVVSWGKGCARPGQYGVYASVGAFSDWLENQTGRAFADADARDDEAAPGTSTSTSTPTAELPPLPRGDRALLVGINRYAEPSFTELKGAVRDALNARRLLEDHLGFESGEIVVLTDEAATREGILAGIEGWLSAGTRPGARAVLYFAGHGYYRPDDDGDEPDGFDEALVPYDARLVSNAEQPLQVENLILDDEIGDLLARIDDRKVHVIVDSCHSGTMTRSLTPAAADPRFVRTIGLGSGPGGVRAMTKSPAFSRGAVAARQRDTGFIEADGNLVVWTAVSPLQLALEDRESEEPQGVFTSRFVRGISERLADRNGDGRVVHVELLDYVRSESEAYCSRHPRDCKEGLTPSLEARRDLLMAEVMTGDPVVVEETAPAAVAEDTLGYTNEAEVRLEIRPSTRLRLGETVTYRVRSARSGHLLVVDVSADGVTQLFPNRYSDRAGKGAWIDAGRAIEVPNPYYGFSLEASPPTGEGALVAIVTEDPIVLDDLLDRNRDFQPVADPQGWLLALGERLRKPWPDEDRTREALWSAAWIDYEIVP